MLDQFSIAGFTAVAGGVPTRDSTMADFTLAALSGAGTALETLLEGPINLPGGRLGYQAHVKWIAGEDPTPETIIGVVVFEPGDPNVYQAAELFAAPVLIAQEGDYLSYDLIFALPDVLHTGLLA